MTNPIERPANLGDIACVRDAQTGDYSLSLHSAIAVLTKENQRLRIIIDDLLNKIECLRCGSDLPASGSA